MIYTVTSRLEQLMNLSDQGVTFSPDIKLMWRERTLSGHSPVVPIVDTDSVFLLFRCWSVTPDPQPPTSTEHRASGQTGHCPLLVWSDWTLT